MEELKPRLILTKSNKSGFNIGKYIFFLTIFIVGFYFGYSYRSLDSDILLESKNKISKVTEKRFKKLDLDKSAKSLLAKNSDNSQMKDVVFKPNVRKNIIVTDKNVQNSINDSDVKILSSNKKLQDDENLEESSSKDNTYYTLQIAAFETERKSNEVVEELSSKGYKVYSISVLNSQGDRWNLVRLGNFATLNEAREFSELLLNSEGINANIETIEKSKLTSSNKFY